MQKLSEKLFLLFLAVMLAILVLARINYCHIPFERDEGEYAYAGSLLLHGQHPYSEAYNMKFPGAYFMYALFMKVGGESIEAVRIGVCLVVFLTAFLIGAIVYLFSRNFVSAVLGSVIYVALTNTMGGEGLMANAEHFVNLFAVAGFFLLLFTMLKRDKPYLLFASGALLGCSVIMKQYGYAFCLFGFALVLVQNSGKSLREALKAHLAFILGGLLPALVLVGWLIKNGLWQKFQFLTLQYALTYLKYYPTDANVISARTASLIALALIIAMFLLFYICKNRFGRIIIAWIIFSIVAVGTGGLFRLHYFILAYPALAAALAFLYFNYRSIERPLPGTAQGIVAIIFCLFLMLQRDELFAHDPLAVFKKHYAGNYFEEMPRLATAIDGLLPKGDKLSLFSCEPELLFYTRRISASGYIYNYPLFEPQPYAGQMTSEFISEVEANPSRLFVYQAPPQVYNDSVFRRFSNWWNRYSQKYYLKGLYYRDSDSTGLFIWEEEIKKDTSWRTSHRFEFWLRKD